MNINSLRFLDLPNFWKIFLRSTQTRILWACTFLICTLIFVYQSFDRLQMVVNVPKSAFVKLKHAENLVFPAVTICPGYLMRASIEKRFVEIDRFGCRSGKRECAWEFPWNMATVTEIILKNCHFKRDWSCMPGAERRGKWRRIFSSLGRCFTYKPDKGDFVTCGGDLSALELEIDPMLWDKSGILLLNGIRVYIHNENEPPLFEINGININEGASASYALHLTQFNRLPDGDNPCNADVDYTRNSCIIQCIYDEALKLAQVKCRSVFMTAKNFPICDTRKEISALTSAYSNIVNNGSYWDLCAKLCPESCQKIVYTPITSSLGFTRGNDSLIRIQIYFRDMWFRTVTEVWDYSIEKFVANVGGSMNLFLGASFITIVQVLDVLMCKVALKLREGTKALQKHLEERLFVRNLKHRKIPVAW